MAGTSESFVIIGGGLAGATAARTLREEGFTGRVVLIGDEMEPPYERPPLSKDYLLGKSPREATFVHPRHWYAENRIELLLGSAAIDVDHRAQVVALADGRRIGYDKLLLATGSSPRRLSVPGDASGSVQYLRRLDDSDRIKALLRSATSVAVIGGGWIGLETAAAARISGVEVTVLETSALPLIRVLGPELARVFADLHVRHGVDLRSGVHTTAIHATADGGSELTLSDGSRVRADAVIAGVGITPNVGLAERAGLIVDNGVQVDAHLRSSNENIYAAGDVANAWHPVLGRHIRVEHWANALHQGPVAARAMLGQPAEYRRLPYFFTDQYDLGMEYIGYTMPGRDYQVVIRGEVQSGEFIAFWLDRGVVAAGMCVNTWDMIDRLGELITSGVAVDADRLADPAAPLPAGAPGPLPV